MLLNCGVGVDLRESLDCKETKLVNPKGNQSWIFIGRTNTEAETPILEPPDVKNSLLGKGPVAGKDWRQEEKGDDRGRDGGTASLTQWPWVGASSGRWWETGKRGVLQSMGSQRVGHDWATEQQQCPSQIPASVWNALSPAWKLTHQEHHSPQFLLKYDDF